jgi:glucuronoarabinoxylan endo-1,4-beta-xylanase
MVRNIAACCAVLTGFIASAQTINLGGMVSNKAGQPVNNAVVTLVRQGMKDTTGIDGKYSLAKSVAVKSPAPAPRTEDISMNSGIVHFNLSHALPIKIELFTVQGMLLKKEVLMNAAAGTYRFDVARNCGATNLFVIKAAIGKREARFRYAALSIGNRELNFVRAPTFPVGGGLAKTAAVLDTLSVTAAGFLTGTIAITSYDNQQQNITLDSAGTGGAVTIRLDQARQTIDGFGINNNWGALDNNAIKALFDSATGLGLSILRIGMGSGGDLTSGNNWNEVKNAAAAGCKYVIGSTWSPPGSWKTNGSENNGGYLKPEYYTQWAERIAAFPGKVKSGAGVDLYAMSIGNEPDFASCGSAEPCNGNYPTTLYNDTQVVNFIKVAGPKLHAAGCKVMAPEASEWLHTWSDSSACCSEPGKKKSSDPLKGKGYDYGHALYKNQEAWAQLDILGVHQYDTQVAEPWPGDVAGRKPVWQTEMSGVKWWPEQGPSTTIENGVAVAGWIHNALTVGEANAWCYWWYKAQGATNEGLLNSDGSDTKRHYTFGNYTRFVRPGFTRVDITGNIPQDVLLTAFKGNGSVVIVAINKGAASANVPITIAGATPPASFTPWVTSASDNLVSKTAVAVSGATFTAALAGKTVTTFVGK